MNDKGGERWHTVRGPRPCGAAPPSKRMASGAPGGRCGPIHSAAVAPTAGDDNGRGARSTRPSTHPAPAGPTPFHIDLLAGCAGGLTHLSGATPRRQAPTASGTSTACNRAGGDPSTWRRPVPASWFSTPLHSVAPLHAPARVSATDVIDTRHPQADCSRLSVTRSATTPRSRQLAVLATHESAIRSLPPVCRRRHLLLPETPRTALTDELLSNCCSVASRDISCNPPAYSCFLSHHTPAAIPRNVPTATEHTDRRAYGFTASASTGEAASIEESPP
jgi:hypothetical protein